MNIFWNSLTATFAGAVCSLLLLLLPLDHQVSEQSILPLSLPPPLIKTHGSVGHCCGSCQGEDHWMRISKYYDDSLVSHCFVIYVHA